MSDKDWNHNPTVKRWIIIGAAFLLALVFIACMSGHPAGAATLDPGVSVATPIPFSAVGVPLPVADRPIHEAGKPKPGPCWGWGQDFPVHDQIGKTMYDPGVRVQWCANRARTKVTQLVIWDAYDGGGYYDWHAPADKSKGKLGYASLGLSANWLYTWFMGIPGVTDTRTPSIVFSVYANSAVIGTIYYDN